LHQDQHQDSGCRIAHCHPPSWRQGENARRIALFPTVALAERNPPGKSEFAWDRAKGIFMGTILIIVLLLLLLGAWPAWPYSRGWGYYPSGTLGLVLVIVLVLALMGRI
jgi:hypothetical protein